MGNWDHLTPKDVPTVEIDWEDITDFDEWLDHHPEIMLDQLTSWAKLLEVNDKEVILGRNYCWTADDNKWSEVRLMPAMLPKMRVIEEPKNIDSPAWLAFEMNLDIELDRGGEDDVDT